MAREYGDLASFSLLGLSLLPPISPQTETVAIRIREVAARVGQKTRLLGTPARLIGDSLAESTACRRACAKIARRVSASLRAGWICASLSPSPDSEHCRF